MKNYAVNIGRNVGSGGHEIAEIISQRLKWKFYDQELIKIAAIQSGYSEDYFHQYDEKDSIITSKSLNIFTGSNISPNIENDTMFSPEYLFKISSNIMRKISSECNAVFVGRCADYVLRDDAFCINIFCYAPLSVRINNIISIYNCSAREAEKIILRGDKNRSHYYSKYSNKKWGDASSYHILIDTSALGINLTADFLIDYIKKKMNL